METLKSTTVLHVRWCGGLVLGLWSRLETIGNIFLIQKIFIDVQRGNADSKYSIIAGLLLC